MLLVIGSIETIKSTVALLLAVMLDDLQHEGQPITEVAVVVRLYPLSQPQEGSLHVAATLGAHLLVDHPVLLCELAPIFRGYLSLCFEVALGGNQHLHDPLSSHSLDLLRPRVEILERVCVGDIVGEDDGLGALKIGLGDVAKSFLPGSIPDLQLDGEVVYLHVLELEVDADGGDVALLEDSLAVLGHEVGLAHSAIPDYYYFGQKSLLAAWHYFIIFQKEITAFYSPSWKKEKLHRSPTHHSLSSPFKCLPLTTSRAFALLLSSYSVAI